MFGGTGGTSLQSMRLKTQRPRFVGDEPFGCDNVASTAPCASRPMPRPAGRSTIA
jgi:hypothetical protein